MAGRKRSKDQEREDRIAMEIVVDAYGEQERAMGWYCYLDDRLHFPFTASCTAERETSPLARKDEVEVLRMAGSEECFREMFVVIRWGRARKGSKGLAVPLSQLKPGNDADELTREAVGDWHYWVRMRYEF